MENNQLANEWFEIAQSDLSSAHHLLTMHPLPIEIICYHCQQAAEKYLKGFLFLKKHEIIKTHDLVLLNKTCGEYDEEFANIADECLRLTDFSVTVRYPYPFDLNESDMKIALADATRIKEFVNNKFDNQ